MFPGVGAFQQCMGTLECKRLIQPLKEYIQAGSCFLRLLVDTHGSHLPSPLTLCIPIQLSRLCSTIH